MWSQYSTIIRLAKKSNQLNKSLLAPWLKEWCNSPAIVISRKNSESSTSLKGTAEIDQAREQVEIRSRKMKSESQALTLISSRLEFRMDKLKWQLLGSLKTVTPPKLPTTMTLNLDLTSMTLLTHFPRHSTTALGPPNNRRTRLQKKILALNKSLIALLGKSRTTPKRTSALVTRAFQAEPISLMGRTRWKINEESNMQKVNRRNEAFNILQFPIKFKKISNNNWQFVSIFYNHKLLHTTNSSKYYMYFYLF